MPNRLGAKSFGFEGEITLKRLNHPTFQAMSVIAVMTWSYRYSPRCSIIFSGRGICVEQ